MRRIGSAACLKYGALSAQRTGNAPYWKGDAPAMRGAPAMRHIEKMRCIARWTASILCAPETQKSAADCAKLPGDGRVSLGSTKSSASIYPNILLMHEHNRSLYNFRLLSISPDAELYARLAKC